MENNLESILQTLRLGRMDEADLKLVIKSFLDIHKTDYIDRNRCIVAQTFEAILRQIQHNYFEEEPLRKIEFNNSDEETLNQISNSSTESDLESILTDVVLMFGNIEHITKSASKEEQTDGSICLLRFLSFLKQHNSVEGDNDFTDINDISDILSIISEELEEIRFLFDYKIENKALFPIDKLLVGIISNSQFLTQSRRINRKDYYALKLAVRFFKKDSDVERLVEEIRKDSNLKFIDYLNQDSELIDTTDMLNYQKNGIMVFWNSLNRSALIRCDSDAYFNIATEHEYKIEHEFTKDRRLQIGTFVIINFSKTDNIVNLIDLIEDYNRREEVLRLFFSGGRNIFLPGAILETWDGKLRPLNPFTSNDQYIIKESKYCLATEISKAFDEYSNLILKRSRVNTMNCVVLGTFTMLMGIDDRSWEKVLDLDAYGENDFYQNQMIHRWMQFADSDSIEKLILFCCRELMYCSSELEKIREYEIKPQHLMPFRGDISCYCNFLFSPADVSIENTDTVPSIDRLGSVAKIEKTDIFFGTISNGVSGITVFIPDKEELIKSPDIQDLGSFLETISQSEVYFIARGNTLFIIEQNIAKALYGLKKSFENCLSFDCVVCVSTKRYQRLVETISLHRLALLEGTTSVLRSSEKLFNDHAFYRIVHNMVGYGIDKDKVDAYFSLFTKHQLLSFNKIMGDSFFSMTTAGTLFVPKDGYAADAVLSQIYDIYLKNYSERNSNNLYDDSLTFNNGKYYRNGQEIKEIILLLDNFERGSAAIDCICAYLEIEGEKSAKNIDVVKTRIQHYFYTKELGNRKEVGLKDILKNNKCKFSVHSYYGTEIGRECIDKFLTEHSISHCPTTYSNQITCTFGDIKAEAGLIFPENKPLNEHNYAVIREFNMTKKNVFPDEMITDVKKAITLFVKKKEKKHINIVNKKNILKIEKVVDYVISNSEKNFKDLSEKLSFLYKKFEVQSILDFSNIVKSEKLKENDKNLERGIIDLAVIAFDKYFSQKNLFKVKDNNGNYALTIISTLPPYIRILVWEKYLKHDFSIIALDKLVKAYAKNDQMDKVYDTLGQNFSKDYINEAVLEVLIEEAELLNKSKAKLPIAHDMKSASRNYRSLMQNDSYHSATDPEFIEIMDMIVDLVK